jgi:predicted GNAT family N-acyltransferase
MEIRAPKTTLEWELYYDLRFRVLREPWNQPRGSDRNDGDASAQHFAVWEKGKPLAVARLDETEEKGIVQVRFVAVESNQQGRGLGKIIMLEAEKVAKEQGKHRIILHARENALEFYKRLGYSVVEQSYLLFDEIQHYLMGKEI